MSGLQQSLAVKAAQALLDDRDRNRTEGNVQSSVEALLRVMDLGTLESQYQTGKGPVDIYLPNRQAIIEVKAYPQAKDPEAPQSGRKESAREQLDRYVIAEIDNEHAMLFGKGG